MSTTTDWIEFVLAGPGDETRIATMMALFNEDELIVWRPETMVPALGRLLAEPGLGLVLLVRERSSGAYIGYGVATFGYDIEFSGRDAFVTELFVDASFRGRGVGRQLLDALAQRLRESGAKAVHLMVRPENTRARSLYEQQGFRMIPRLLMTKVLCADTE